MITLQDLLGELQELNRNSVNSSLDNSIRTRAFNWVIQDIQSGADWEPTIRNIEFEFIGGVNEYSLKNYLAATCLDNDGATSIGDFKSPKDLRLLDASSPFKYRDVKDVRNHILNGRLINEYGIDNDLLVINYPSPASNSLHNCDSLTADGTWAASSDATNLTIDEVEKKQGNACLNFDVSAGTSLVLTNPDLTAIDLSSFENVGVLTMWVYLPTITNFTSVAIKWGSSATAYWSKTETAPISGESLKVGWNLFGFKWKDATKTLTPDETAIDYLQITITYSGATIDTDFRIDDIRMAGITEMELDYYSQAMVLNAAGDYQKEFNADDVTQTDGLVSDYLRSVFIEGANYRCFRVQGGDREQDLTDSYNLYSIAKKQAKNQLGHNIKKPIRRFQFIR